MRLVTTSTSGNTTEHAPAPNARAEIGLKRAVRNARREYGPEHVNVALCLIQLADYLANHGKYSEAEAAYRQTASIYDALGVGHELLLAIALRSLSQTLIAQGRHSDGAKANHQATELILSFQ